MKKLTSLTLIGLCLIAFTSCSSIFCGSKAKVTFESDIEETATLTIDGQKHNNGLTVKFRWGWILKKVISLRYGKA